MTTEKKHVAIITASPALGSIIAMMLEQEEQLHIQQFNDASMLTAHMRIAPVDLIVMDYHLGQITAAQLVLNLRHDQAQRKFKTLVLTSIVSAEIKLACKFARIDEVIIKPMSPMFLKERMLSRLQGRPLQARPFASNDASDHAIADISGQQQKNNVHWAQETKWGSNVVPLFKSGHVPSHRPNQPRHF